MSRKKTVYHLGSTFPRLFFLFSWVACFSKLLVTRKTLEAECLGLMLLSQFEQKRTHRNDWWPFIGSRKLQATPQTSRRAQSALSVCKRVDTAINQEDLTQTSQVTGQVTRTDSLTGSITCVWNSLMDCQTVCFHLCLEDNQKALFHLKMFLVHLLKPFTMWELIFLSVFGDILAWRALL